MEFGSPTERPHDFVAIRSADEGLDCEQCGWHLSKTSLRVRLAGAVTAAASGRG